MPQILVTVDQATVKYNPFNITMNASFNGIVGSINSAQIKTVVPKYLAYTPPTIVPPLQNIITNVLPSGDTELTFDFGAITDLGQAIVLTYTAQFKVGTPNGTVYQGDYDLYVNGSVVATTKSPPVTLQLTPVWSMDKIMPIPANNQPAPGGSAIYLIRLVNSGDAGVPISNVVVTDTLPAGMTFDPFFTPYGTDWSGYDPSANANGVVVGNTVTFTIANYFGTAYYMVFKVNIDPSVPTNTQITNTANWTVGGTAQPSANQTTTVTAISPDAQIGKYGPSYSKPGNDIDYDIYFSNPSNGTINNLVMIDVIPPEVILQKVFPGSFYIPVVNIFPAQSYTFDYEINNSGVYVGATVFPYNNPNTWTYIDLTGVVGKVTRIRWQFPVVEEGLQQYEPPRLVGIVDPATTAASTINTVNLYYSVGGVPEVHTATLTTLLNGTASISGYKSNSPSYNVVPTQIIRYQGGVSSWDSQIDNPVVADLLPPEVDYADNWQIAYSDYFDDYAYYTRPGNPGPIPVPVIDVIPNYNGTGRTFVRFTLNGFSVLQRSSLYVSFDVKVKVGATGTVINTMIFGNKGVTTVPNGTAPANQYPDTLDVDGDGITNETLYLTNQVTNVINFSTSLASDKKVKGELDTDYTEEPLVGNTTQGGSVDYKLTVSNIGNVDIQSFEIVDILPYIGDTGVISTTPRLSQFPIYITGVVTASLSPLVVGDPPPQLRIWYSQSSNPQRFDATGTGIIPGVNDWTLIPPADLTTVKSVKIDSVNTIIHPGQNLVIHMGGVAPVGVPTGLVAWNSYALNAFYINQGGILTNLLPVEPEKVGVQVQEPADKVTIGDYVWEDLNGNGIQDPGEPGVNGVTVQLYDSTGTTLLDTTVTANDFGGNAGYYLFTNKDPGCYVVKFILPSNYAFTIQNAGTDPTKNSKANPLTGKTAQFCVTTPGSSNLTIDAGIICPITIHAKNRCIYEGDPFDPMQDVTATDCKGRSVPVIIIENTVNTQVPGTYSITYQATNADGQVATKTVVVKVSKKSFYHQAINDVVLSVSLEETALSHILNAEGEKIQKALTFKPTYTELIQINQSVADTANAIALLESVLQDKVSIVSCDFEYGCWGPINP
ncbi:MAG: SdrD B-like domain-containing protein [Angelakisella sp.]